MYRHDYWTTNVVLLTLGLTYRQQTSDHTASMRFDFIPREDAIASAAGVLVIANELRKEYQGDPLLWRGQPNANWGLRPTIGRTHYHIGSKVSFNSNTETALLVRFRRYSYLELKRALTGWETLLLAREHGLPVRLLDWTTKSYGRSVLRVAILETHMPRRSTLGIG